MLTKSEEDLRSAEPDFSPQMMAHALYGHRHEGPTRKTDEELDPVKLATIFNNLREQVADLTGQLEEAKSGRLASEAEADRAACLARDYNAALSSAAEDLRMVRSELTIATERAEAAEKRAHDLSERIEAARSALTKANEPARSLIEEPENGPSDAHFDKVEAIKSRPLIALSNVAQVGTRKRSLLGWIQ